MTHTEPMPTSAYTALDEHTVRSSPLTRGPWDPGHQHAGPPIAWVCRSVERVAQGHGLTHIGRITANLLRPVPIADLTVEVAADYVGRNAGHFSARLISAGKELARFTILAQRENEVPLPANLPGHPAPPAPPGPLESPPATFPFASRKAGYADLVETRVVHGQFFKGPCTVWFRLRYPLLEGEVTSAYQRVAVAADSGNGISAVLDFARYSFVNSDLTINLLRRPQGEWICLDAQTHLGPNGCGLAQSRLFDTQGLVGTATQSLSVRLRNPG
jgi:hypothetical protein